MLPNTRLPLNPTLRVLNYNIRGVSLFVSFAVPCKFSVVNSLIRTIALNTFGFLYSANSSQMAPLPTIFALWYSRIHVCSSNCNDETSNIKSSVDENFGLKPALRVLYIDPNDKHVRLG